MGWGSQMYIFMFITNEKIFIGFYRLNDIISALGLRRTGKNMKCFYNNTELLEISHVPRSF